MSTNSYIQWYNENEGRAYPLAEDVSAVSNAGSRLPEDIVVDLGIMADPMHTDIHFSSIRITPAFISVALKSSVSGLLVGTFSRTSLTAYKAYPLTAVGSDVSGWIAFGNHRAVTVEDYRFSSAEQSGIEDRCVRRVNALPIRNIYKLGGRSDQVASGIVTLRAGSGVVIENPSAGLIVIRLDATLRDQLAGPCNRAADSQNCGVPPIRSINGVCPNEDGEITVRFT